ncbi:MAG: ATP-grasp domain-containing protein [Deltaproteobacteria bacterium]|nr:ATP-grasp domain-containing protein [Deltaproteobacteria bacterium]
MSEQYTGKFSRIAIINRGEPAMRLIRAVRDWNASGKDKIQTIAFYTEPDRQALYVREADYTYNLGPAMFADENDCDENGRPRSKCRYLDYKSLKEALIETKAQAAWVGWGFVAEHAQFAQMCQDMGVIFIGPSAEAMRRLGDKIASKQLAEGAGVPVAPWSGGKVTSIKQARQVVEKIGYPLMVKASAGGGGRGIRHVKKPDELEYAVESSMNEALKAFGDSTIFIEACVTGARHIEIQVIADSFGEVWALGTRDCTAQRSRQKVIEEAPSTALSARSEAELRQAAVNLAKAAKYCNAGTVEFLYDPIKDVSYFMEMNTRLQVEHPVTEETTGIDLVIMQLAVAQGERIVGEPPATVGHAIEVRLCAEDPDRGFAPAPGRVLGFRPPLGSGVRTDSGVREGDNIPLEFDSMILKIIARGSTRTEAIARLRRALDETRVVIEGGTTNRAFLTRLLEHPEFISNNFDTQWIDNLMQQGGVQAGPQASVALIATAIRLHERQLSEQALNFFAAAARGRPNMPAQEHRAIELRYDGGTYEFRVAKLGPDTYRLAIDSNSIDVTYESDGQHEARLSFVTADGKSCHRIVSMNSGADYLVEVDSNSYRISGDPGGVVRAPAPGLVLAMHVAEGDHVDAGARLLSLEAMKMEMPLTASVSGRVRKLLVSKSMQVGAGDALLILEPEGTQTTEAKKGSRLNFPQQNSVDDFSAVLDDMRRVMLGFDVGSVSVDDLIARFIKAPSSNATGEVRAIATQELLDLYLDLAGPFSRRLLKEAGSLHLSYGACLHLYLREFQAEGSGLPGDFIATLRTALTHYGVNTLNDSDKLRDALAWLYRSHQNATRKNKLAIALLQRCLEDSEWRASASNNKFADMLQRLVRVTRDQHPLVYEAAEQARYTLFTGRALEKRQQRALANLDKVLKELFTNKTNGIRNTSIIEAASTPYTLVDHLAPMLTKLAAEERQLVLEILLRHFYRTRKIADVFTLNISERPQVMVSFDDNIKQSALMAYTDIDELKNALSAIEAAVNQMPQDACLDVNLVVSVDKTINIDSGNIINTYLAELKIDKRLNAICFILANDTTVQPYTYQLVNNSWCENEILRGIYPTVAERIELWRLKNFKLTRIPTVLQDLYLFHAIAHENERDERLFAIAELREIHPVRDPIGKLITAPEVEHVIQAAFQAIREQQARRDAKRRLHWNRVTIFMRQSLLARREELLRMAERLHVSAEGLGLEKVVLRMSLQEHPEHVPHDTIVSFTNPTGHKVDMNLSEPHRQPLRVLDDYSLRVVRARQRRLTYAYEIVKMLAPDEATIDLPAGKFEEFDLGDNGDQHHLISVAGRPFGRNIANVVVGLVRNYTSKYSEGMTRVLIVGDGTRDMGALGEPECRRIIASLDLAEKMGLPLEWFPVSSGAKIAMDSGTENLDWTAAVLRRIIEFTQNGGEINIIVDGINVGAQSYWNAEATMLMHTHGCLIMTPRGSMLLTGKRALDYSGGVSAEDNLGIGGFERIMGPNGQAQYHANDLRDACRILMRYYEHTYIAPGEKHPRKRITSDTPTRDVTIEKYLGPETFEKVGDVLTDSGNPGRHKPFDIRAIMRSVADQDALPLERWSAMRDGEMAVTWDTHLGGWPISLIGIESKSLPRLGWAPSDGPTTWSGGTLFPIASKKVARAINSASNNRPVVVLANLSGFDGSPESMRLLQLEYGAEIGRAVVNFRGPLVFCVIARYHGGAYVVFSKRLNPELSSLAIEGSYASVIGGPAAAAVVFPDSARTLALKDEEIIALDKKVKQSGDPKLKREYQELYTKILAEKTQVVAKEFDKVHSVQRALSVGSLDRILRADSIRPALIETIEQELTKSTATIKNAYLLMQ